MIGKRMSKIWSKQGLSADAVAIKLDVPVQVIHEIENGVREPSEGLIRLFCLEYGFNHHWLKTGEGEARLTARKALEEEFDCASENAVRHIAIARFCDGMIDSDAECEFLNGDSRRDLIDAEHAYSKQFALSRHKVENLLDDLDEFAMDMRGAAERMAYEDGMRFGARIIYQLLQREDRQGEKHPRIGLNSQKDRNDRDRHRTPNNGHLTRDNGTTGSAIEQKQGS